MGVKETVDVSSIYRAVLNRRSRPARLNGQLNAAIAMCEAIKVFEKVPSRENLEKFAAEEERWLAIVGERNKSYAHELRALLRNGKLIEGKLKSINSPHNSSYDPPHGYVYGMTSLQHPRLVKLGVTSRNRHPTERLEELSKKYKLVDLKICFLCEITSPGKAETEWTKRFDVRRAPLKNNESREWFRFEPAEAYAAVFQIVKDLGLREYSPWYMSKEIRNGTTYKDAPGGRNAMPGTLAALPDLKKEG